MIKKIGKTLNDWKYESMSIQFSKTIKSTPFKKIPCFEKVVELKHE